jgi:hypothetical protein
MTRADIRTHARTILKEASADLYTDGDLNTYILDEIRSLPSKGIFLEEVWKRNLVVDVVDYILPSGTYDVQSVEENIGSSTDEEWQPLEGWGRYAGALWLPTKPTTTSGIRVKIKKNFTEPTDEGTVLDIPAEKEEIVAVGTALRATRQIIHDLIDAKNYNAIAKPDGISMPQIQSFMRDLKADYRELVNQMRVIPKTGQIDLVN